MAEQTNIQSMRAPRPKKASYMRSLYDSVDAIGGRATLSSIINLIPTTDDAGRWSKAKPDYVSQMLYQAVHAGYLSTGEDENGHAYWKVAPISYYHARQEALKQPAKRREKPKVQRHSLVVERNVKELWYAGCAGFMAGVIISLSAWALLS